MISHGDERASGIQRTYINKSAQNLIKKRCSLLTYQSGYRMSTGCGVIALNCTTVLADWSDGSCGACCTFGTKTCRGKATDPGERKRDMQINTQPLEKMCWEKTSTSMCTPHMQHQFYSLVDTQDRSSVFHYFILGQAKRKAISLAFKIFGFSRHV